MNEERSEISRIGKRVQDYFRKAEYWLKVHKLALKHPDLTVSWNEMITIPSLVPEMTRIEILQNDVSPSYPIEARPIMEIGDVVVGGDPVDVGFYWAGGSLHHEKREWDESLFTDEINQKIHAWFESSPKESRIY